jgi:hypothetical protein
MPLLIGGDYSSLEWGCHGANRARRLAVGPFDFIEQKRYNPGLIERAGAADCAVQHGQDPDGIMIRV